MGSPVDSPLLFKKRANASPILILAGNPRKFDRAMAAEEERPPRPSPTLDSVLDQALANSSAVSSQDAVLVALHSILLSAGFVCVATGDEVAWAARVV